MQDMRVGMKPGESFKIRLLPREIQVCAAIVQLIAPDAANLSLAQVVRIALTELCEAAVKCGIVSEPSEFDYEASISKYRRGAVPRSVELARKVQTSRVIFQEQMRSVAAGGTAAFGRLRFDAVQGADADASAPHTPAISHDVKRRKLRFDELKFKSEQDPENMSAKEFREMRQLGRALGATT